MTENLGISPEGWAQIQEQFKNIISEAGVEPEETYQKELEEIFGMSIEEMNRDTETAIKSKVLGVELIHPDAKFPTYAYKSDSGFDLHSVVDCIIPPSGRALIPTGIKLSIPDDCEVQVRPKSGLAINHGLTVLNTPGTVDSGYNGEIKVIVLNAGGEAIIINKGMKIAQAVLCPVFTGKYVRLNQLDKIDDTDRGDNGFGSTGII
jgi:dUTP pyrophosphatase